jgi:hypothetical protein
MLKKETSVVIIGLNESMDGSDKVPGAIDFMKRGIP